MKTQHIVRIEAPKGLDIWVESMEDARKLSDAILAGAEESQNYNYRVMVICEGDLECGQITP